MNILRPAGNKIVTKTSKLAHSPFAPYFSQFYQSGTASLAATILAAQSRRPEVIRPEVIIPAYGCPDLISASVYANVTPVLIDIEPNSPRIDLKQLEHLISKNTIAIVAVRFFGIAEHTNRLKEICLYNNLTLIEDSAQGFPNSKYDGYWQGDYIVLSFGRGKPINLLNGGAVLGRNDDLMKRLPTPSPVDNSVLSIIKQQLKLSIYNTSIHPLFYGLISRLPGLSIGKTIYKPLESLESISNYTLSILAENIDVYRHAECVQKEYFKQIEKLSNELIVNLPIQLKHPPEERLLRYPILIKDPSFRNLAYKKLHALGASVMYKRPLHKISNIGNLIKQHSNDFPNASNFANTLLTLPTHEGVTKSIKQNILDILQTI